MKKLQAPEFANTFEPFIVLLDTLVCVLFYGHILLYTCISK